MPVGYLLVGHGTRNRAGCAEFLQLVEQVRGLMGDVPLEPAFLELAEPSIDTALDRLRRQKVTELICVPVILLAAGHVKRDIPEAVQRAAQRSGLATVRFAEHLGCREAMLKLSQLQYRAALEQAQPHGPVGWVLVGRGTHDPEALAEIRQFQQLRSELEPVPQHWLGFLAMASPRLSEVLELAARSPAESIVIQPHLLFPGDLLGRTEEMTAQMSQKYPDKQWILAAHLGPHRLLVESIARQVHGE